NHRNEIGGEKKPQRSIGKEFSHQCSVACRGLRSGFIYSAARYYGSVAVDTVSNVVPLNFTTLTVRGVTAVDVRTASVNIEMVSGCPISTSNRVVGSAVPLKAPVVAGSDTWGFSATSRLLVVVVVPLVLVVVAIA